MALRGAYTYACHEIDSTMRALDIQSYAEEIHGFFFFNADIPCPMIRDQHTHGDREST